MKFTILTLFPDMFAPVLHTSILGRAEEKGILSYELIQIRDFSLDKHRRVDDYPFGGGAGLVMTPQPLIDAIAAAQTQPKSPVIYLSPKGVPFTQHMAETLSKESQLILLCGHYEGIDERVLINSVDLEISLGDFVLTGGEIPAMALIDAVARLVPGVLGESSHDEESFYNHLLEYPQYTRPAEYNGMSVPPVLLNGHHAQIAQWRREQALRVTWERRPDLLAKANLNDKEKALISQWETNQ